ncbi:MAG: bifunctional adenosylcobinamide kinase/adenosylcobinamide-phosphate guanylyltransferase [Pseudomonadota bacterium]
MTLSDLPKLTLVIGGACSGKSGYAESLCFQSGRSRVYIATAQAFDDEMREKILLHQAQRGENWRTIEAPLDVVAALDKASEEDVVLLDCATLWLSNALLAERDLDQMSNRLLQALAACPAPVIVVSNEVGQGVVPDTKLGRVFRTAQGRLNQRLAAQADTVIQVIVGLPQVLKGTAR